MNLIVILQIVKALIDIIIKDADGNGKWDLFEKESKNEVPKEN